jgi:hypothetical protein
VPLESGGWLVSKDIRLEIEVALDEVVVAAEHRELVGAAS